jgi:hypothetical protein
MISLWDDTRIKPGAQWRDEIREALDRARVAVLLVSADFLASQFIRTNELPPLLTAAEKRGTRILPLIVSPCRFKQTPSLACFQAVNSPDEPLVGMRRAKREAVFVRLSSLVEEAFSSIKSPTSTAPDSIGSVLMLPRLPADREGFLYYRIRSRIGPELMATLLGLPEDKQRELVSILQRILLLWDNLQWSGVLRGKEEVEREFMSGLVTGDAIMLGEVCQLLLVHIEVILGSIVREQLSREEFEFAKELAGVPTAKGTDQLSLHEKFKILRSLSQEGRFLPRFTPIQSIFSDEVSRVRNAISHREVTRVTTTEIVVTIERLSEVLVWWGREPVE